MKPKATLHHLLALAGSTLLAISSASAQTTYTWTQTATGSQDWTSAANWASSTPFVSGAGNNELRFFADTTIVPTAGGQTIINVPTALSMNTLTFNGRGANTTAGNTITIGTSASTWTIGDGTTSLVNLNATNWSNDRDLRYIIAPNLTLNQTTTTFTGNGTSSRGFIFSGNITQASAGYGITKSGSSFLTFSGTNSYSGPTNITGGTLALGNAGALPSTSALTLNGGVLELNGFNFNRSLGAGSNQFQITGGTSGFSARGGPVIVTVGGNSATELVWGSANFNPTTLQLNRNDYHSETAADPNYLKADVLVLTNQLDLNAATRTIQVSGGKALLTGDIRTSGGTAGLTKTGAGMLVLTGNNSYNGTTTISAGTLSISAAGEVGGSGLSNLSMNGGSLQIRGTALTSLSDLDSTVTFSNTAKGFDIQNASNTFTVDQVLSGTGTGSTLTKSGVGTLVLNQNNTFAGATTVTGGGKLVLDYTTNNGSKLSDTAGLTLSGTALVLKGGVGAGANHAEVVSSTTLGHYTSNSISRDGGSSTISLGALTTPGSNNMHTLSISESGLATTTTGNATGLTNATGILGLGRVTVGSDFGTNSSGNIVAYSDYTNYTAATATGSLSTTVAQLTGGGTKASGNFYTYALRIVNSGDDNVLELGSTQLLLINNSTLLYAGGGNDNYTINGNSSSAISSNSGNQPFVINTYAGTTLTVNTRTSSNFAPVSKAGAGTLVIGGNNPNLGIAYVQEGVLRVTNKDGLGNTTAGTNVLGGAALELANNIAIGAEALSLNGAGISNNGALRNQAGANSFAGAITIGASGARINADASTSLTLTGGITTNLTQDVTFGGAGDTTVSTTAISGSGSVIKDGAGTLTLSGTHTYTGATTVSAGTLLINGSTSTSSAVSVGASGTLGGTGTVGGAVTVNGALKPGNSTGLLTVGSLDLTASATTTFEINGTNRGAASNGYDALGLNTGGSLDLAGALIFEFGNLAAFANNTEFDLFSFDTTATGDFASVVSTGFYAGTWGKTGDVWSLTSGSQTLNFSEVTGNLVVVPEPRAALLGGLGLLVLLRRRRA